jgi:hypothetical protein
MPITPNTPIAVEADYTPVGSENLKLYVNNVEVETKPASAVVDGVIRFELKDGLPVGTHILAVAAADDVEEAKSEDLVLVLTLKLTAPTNVRVSVLAVP